MSNLKKLLIQPKDYFENVKDSDLEKRQPIRLRYLFIIFIIVGFIAFSSQISQFTYGFNEGLGNQEVDENIIKIVGYTFNLVFSLIWAWICVNTLYLVSKVFLKLVENKEIEDKKYFKNLLYVRYIVGVIAASILITLMSFIIKDINLLAIVGSINDLFIDLWTTYILYGILKYYIGTKKIHKILPTILYILTIIITIITLV
ncbi:MAG: YIP1 family protein [Paraclostridium sp.]|uniref:YIP1 family protein n=1 Tax=Paraclostridium sp. TaxID=2023273 RepID=UPI003F4139B1